ncbi:hypothetical protein [Pseudovibrio exalbescens]|uniref:hypothetical protein n=1 Tax=Pseudovibrio exalbescens TaxID=197461 RepID=UPI000C9CEFFE|nr:hypothetical protein [Pseudovibrio exalbescens]
MKQVRVNVRALANMQAVRREKRNGRDVVIVPSATLPDDVVMNEIMYPADEIEKSYKTLERTPAPLGHPSINGMFVSARDPEGINIGWIGAWNENVRREKGRVYLDKVIDVERASQCEGGKRVLDAIEKGGPVHTSTGLLAMMEEANGDVDYKQIARNIEFDHDAILLDESGAATPEQGVGMLVNSNGTTTEIEVINSSLDDVEGDLEMAADIAARALERQGRKPMLERLKTALREAFTATGDEPQAATNEDAENMKVEDQLNELSQKFDKLAESISEGVSKSVGEAVTNAVKPIVDAQEAIQANEKAKEEAEKAGLVEKVVKANMLDEETAKETPLSVLRKLAPKAEPGKAASLNAAFDGGSNDPLDGFKAPKGD